MSDEEPEKISEFEKLRQSHETQNERVINYIQFAHYTSVLIANILTHYLPVASFQTPLYLLAIFAGSALFRVGLFFYFRTNPSYFPARKYLITSVDLVLTSVIPFLFGYEELYTWVIINFLVFSILAMNTVLSGLRYCTTVVLYNGFASLFLYLILFPWYLSADIKLPVMFTGVMILSVTTICMAYAVSSLIKIHREAANKEQLARFLPPELVDQVSKYPDLLERKTQHSTATVLFTDIRGFTRLSEQLTAKQVVDFLNEFLEEMTIAIMDHDGMLDKYIGDAVMGVFGVPLNQEDHAKRALDTAVDMQSRLNQLNQKLVERGLPELSIGIGLHTGDLLIGAIGSTRRLDYTVIGDTVNVASRIEGMTRNYPVSILVSDSTRDAIGDEVPLHEIATVQVKNREEPLKMWSPDPPDESLAT